jgi:exoribonuclease R
VPLHLSSAGATGELAAALAAIPADLGIIREFPPAVAAEAETMATTAELPEFDSTSIPFVTIDPEGSKDLDQAMYLERDGDGYRVYYAIADVPAFVLPGSLLDAEARRRGLTIYAPDGRIPLHPPVLSEGAASLLPGQLRGAFVWDLRLDADANVTRFTVYRARVTSREQLSYTGVQKSLDDGTASNAMRLLREVGEKRVTLEQARGGASLSMPDTEVEPRGSAYELVRRQPLQVENWNAQISLMTGMAAAELMLTAGVGILRTMPPADEGSTTKFRRQTAALGHPWPETQLYGDYLRSIDTAEPKQLAIMHAAGSLFRGAGYTAFDGARPEHTIQAAVGAPYAHATAPLRRLVDRFVLTLCEALAAGDPVPGWVREALPTLPTIMAKASNLSGELDRRALDTVEAAVLEPNIGQIFDGTVLSAGQNEGMVQITTPPVVAKCTGQLAVGSRISVRLVTADVPTGTVNFVTD